MAQEENQVWPTLMCGGLMLAGIFMPVGGCNMLPPARADLLAVEQVGPPSVSLELVEETRRRGSVSYRVQHIGLRSGRNAWLVTPPRGNWVEGLDYVGPKETVHFLIDPHAGIVYEAILNGRVLLSFDAAHAARRGRGLATIYVGLALLAGGAFGLYRTHRSRPLPSA
ncbi:hypothetical protein LJR030_000435 [Rhizobium sp. LjRoot30]|uniref:hypothetical protein n=1 Tax=Rhizobium sp. LjRoot30 TaxID=3342320 RepID=UPI003ED0B7E2